MHYSVGMSTQTQTKGIEMTIAIEVSGAGRVFNRDRLATAILLRYEHPQDARAVVNTLETDYGVEHHEAMRLTIAAQKCIDLGIEP